ncbi:hypothetical protein C8Q79DRAFT_1012028 [Trametes meyenii]|nr:hypothetical protein C8Q79DRAFT_1012028 [Trametes meyenii]
MDFSEYLDEQDWCEFKRPGVRTSYTRPMYGSEVLLHQTHRFMDGLGEVCMGITLNTTLDESTLRGKVLDGLAYLRFVSPILASTIELDISDPDLPSWVYTAAADVEQVHAWALESLETVEDPLTPDDFVAVLNQRRLPYRRLDGVGQYFRAFLLTNLDGKPAFAIHGTHAIFDAHPTLKMFSILLEHIATGRFEDQPNSLPWGTEWKNLPPGPIIATGGPRSDFNTKGLELLGMMQRVMSSPTPTLSLRPTRSELQNPDKNLRVCYVVDEETLSRLIRRSKEKGYTVTQLFEAAHALAIFHSNSDVDATQDHHVTMEGSYISLFKYMVPPYNRRSHIIGGMAMVPIKHPGSIVRDHKGVKEQLVAAMDNLRASYSTYTSNPNITAVTAVAGRMMPLKTVPVTRNPNEAVITNIGVIEGLLPFKYFEPGREGALNSKPVVEIADMWFGHRLHGCPKLIVHFWTMKGRMHLLTQTNDAWDADYLDDFLRRIVTIASSIL